MEYHQEEESYQPFTIQISSSSSSSSSSAPSAPVSATASASRARERETMFNKVLTPSDVGKLNRLVIPKQQAERHFPLLGPSSPDKGTELLFEDLRTGKQWLFRYCYWGSSQSYVMTKGWSRFVRENNLSPGDTIMFSREVIHGQFCIDFRHNRPAPPPPPIPTVELRPVISFTTSTENVTHMFLDFPTPRPVISDVRRGVRLFGVNIDSERHGEDTDGKENQDGRESRSI